MIAVRTLKIFLASALLMLGSCSTGKNAIVNAEYPLEVKEDLVRLGCADLCDAVETFAAENGGELPLDLLSDTTLAGSTLIDMPPS